MQLEIITPEKKVYTGEVTCPISGVDGKFEVLNNHAPIISSLTKGQVRIIDDKQQAEIIDINGGIIEMQNNKIIVWPTKLNAMLKNEINQSLFLFITKNNCYACVILFFEEISYAYV